MERIRTDIVIGSFSDREAARDAIYALKDYDPKEISLIMKDEAKVAKESGTKAAAGAGMGAGVGAVAGGLAGLAIGLSAIVVPDVGTLLIGGPIAAALGLSGAAATTATGAVTGALSGGLLGALIGLGVPRNEAKAYEEKINNGEILLAVPAREGHVAHVKRILKDNMAHDVRSISAMPSNDYATDPWRAEAASS